MQRVPVTVLLSTLSAFAAVSVHGQVVLDTFGSAYTQDFDTLANSGTSATLPAGWALSEVGTGGSVNSSYSTGAGVANAGDTYSFGAIGTTERALGTLLSGAVSSIIGVQFANATGANITSLRVAYTGEMWRLGTVGRGDRLDLQYSSDATALNTGTWVDVDALDFVSPVSVGTVGALDGNAPAQQVTLSSTITGLAVANGGTLWLRWTDFNASGADDGLAVDNFSATAIPEPSTYAGIGGVVALSAALWRRRRR